MIAKNRSFFKGILFLWLIANPLFSNARIQSIELIYDLDEIHEGDTVRLSMEITDHKGRTHHSTSGSYNFSDFNIYHSKEVELIKKQSDYVWVKVNEDQLAANFKLTLLCHLNQTEYRFTIPLVELEKRIHSISIKRKEQVYNGSEFDLNLDAVFKNGHIINIHDSKILSPELFQVEVLSGGYYDTLTQKIHVNDSSFCHQELKFRVWLKSDPWIYSEMTTPIIRPDLIQLDFSHENDQSTASNANNSEHGKDGRMLKVYLRWYQPECKADSLIQLSIRDEKNDLLTTIYMRPDIDIVAIENNGQNGGNGRNGQDGWDSPGYAGNGGDGYNGGDGGDGGDGGNIIVYHNAEMAPFLDQLILSSNPGKGGLGGFGGNPGKGGNGTYDVLSDGCGVVDNRSGKNGTPGKNGRQGRSGFEGKIVFVEIEMN